MDHQGQSAKHPLEQPHPLAAQDKPGTSEQQALVDALVKRELEHLKTRLFSAITHELRTPLASLRLAAGLLVSAPPSGTTEDHRQLFQLILHSSDRLDLLINNLLDYTYLRAEHLQLDMQAVDLRLILESVADLLKPHYSARRQTLDLRLPEEQITVRGDPFRLRSAAQALLDTACKRCPEEGKLRMGCRIQGDHALGWVCDSGPAVPEETREQMFTGALWQATEDAPSLAAFGLGLPLAHGLITLQGGKVWLAETEAQEASLCFHFSLPLARP